jgi:hypothetical protein
MEYPPYVDAYGKIADIFHGIKKASVPPKFTQDFLSTVLGLTSSSYRAMIPLLKKLELLTAESLPTQSYKDYRDDGLSESVLAEKVKMAYSDLYRASEYAHKLPREELMNKLRTLLGVGKEDKNVAKVASTFLELVKLSNFETSKRAKKESLEEPPKKESAPPIISGDESHAPIYKKFGISYTINLNLPATTEIEVYNSIFKALKENLLNE